MELEDYHQYVVNIDRSGRLSVRNCKVLRKFNPHGCKSLSNILYLRKAIIPLQNFFFGNNWKRNSKERFGVVRSQKGLCMQAGDNFCNIFNAKPATFLLT